MKPKCILKMNLKIVLDTQLLKNAYRKIVYKTIFKELKYT